MEWPPLLDSDAMPFHNEEDWGLHLNDDSTGCRVPEYLSTFHEVVDANLNISNSTQWPLSPDSEFIESNSNECHSDSVAHTSGMRGDFELLINDQFTDTSSGAGIMVDNTDSWPLNHCHSDSVDSSEVLYLAPYVLRLDESLHVIKEPPSGSTSPTISNTGTEYDRKPRPARRLAPASAGSKKKAPQNTTSSGKRAQNAKELKPQRLCDARRESKKFDKPEKCSECNNSFAWRRDRNRHIVVHHPSQAIIMGISTARMSCPYLPCITVDKTFRRKDHLKRHLRRKHGE